MSDVYDVANTVNDLEFFRRNYGPDVPFIDLSFIVGSFFVLIFYAHLQTGRRQISQLSELIGTTGRTVKNSIS